MNKKIKYPIIKWAKELSKIYRSITGDGVVKTLNLINTYLPNLKIINFRSGKKVFDWNIPDEWNVTEAYVSDLNGNKIIDFKDNFLHLVSYSMPVDKVITRKELLKHIYTDKQHKDAIPYITAYYTKTWGFCIQEKKLKLFKNKKYKVKINSSFKSKGFLRLGEIYIKGSNKKEIFFSTYICHPVMANNESSGPALAISLVKYIKENFKNTKYSYRFVFLPETIGSIAYLSKNYKNLKKNVLSGYVLSCVGDDRAYSILFSPSESELSDLSLQSALINKKNLKLYSFLNRGSDERQYCSPKINLPVSTFCRSKFGEYPEYHTSKDDFKLVTQKGLENSFDVISSIIDAFETGIYPLTKVYCEPMLSKRNLYPKISKKNNIFGRSYLDILSYCNGKNSIFEISIKTNQNLKNVVRILNELKKVNLISLK